jgi:hypothetical protein
MLKILQKMMIFALLAGCTMPAYGMLKGILGLFGQKENTIKETTSKNMQIVKENEEIKRLYKENEKNKQLNNGISIEKEKLSKDFVREVVSNIITTVNNRVDCENLEETHKKNIEELTEKHTKWSRDIIDKKSTIEVENTQLKGEIDYFQKKNKELSANNQTLESKLNIIEKTIGNTGENNQNTQPLLNNNRDSHALKKQLLMSRAPLLGAGGLILLAAITTGILVDYCEGQFIKNKVWPWISTQFRSLCTKLCSPLLYCINKEVSFQGMRIDRDWLRCTGIN